MKLPFGFSNKNRRFLIVAILCSMGWVLWPHLTCHGETNRQDIHARRVSSYQNVDGAKQEVNLLKSRGYNAYLEKVLIPDKGVWYRVFIMKGPPASRSRVSVERKKKKPVKVRPSTNDPDSKVKMIHRPARKQVPDFSDQGIRDSSLQRQTILQKNVIPDTDNENEAHLPKRKTGRESDVKNSLDSPSPRVFETANIHFDAGRYERAAAILSSIVSKKHNDDALLENSLRLLADCYFFLGKGKDGSFNLKAVDAYKHILRRYPDLRSRNDLVNFRLAECLEQAGNYEEAYAAYEDVIRKYPTSRYKQDVLYKMGEILYRTGRFTHAIEKLRNYLAGYPDGPYASRSSFLLGYCFQQTGRQTDGALWYRNALNKWDNFEELPADVLYDLGLTLFSWQDYSRAASLFATYLNLYPEGGSKKSAMFYLGRSFYTLNRFASALKVFSLLLENYPESGEAYESILFMANIGVMEPTMNFNVCMTGWDYYRNPVGTYDWMRRKFPGGRLEEWLLYQKGYALWKAGRCKEAFDLYCHLLDSYTHGDFKDKSRGYLFLNARRLIEEAYGRGDDLAVADIYYKIHNKISLSAETRDLFSRAGVSLRKLGFLSDASSVWNSLRQHGLNASGAAVLELMVVEDPGIRKGNDVPEEKWNALMKQFTENDGILKETAIKNLADYFYLKGRYDRAVSLYKILLEGKDNPDLLTIKGNYAHALKSNNDCASAIKIYQKIIHEYRDSPQNYEEELITEAYAGLVDCYFENTDYQRGIAASQQAVPRMKNQQKQMWTLFRTGQSYRKMDDMTMMEKTFSELKEKGDETFWPKVVDYWVADQAWSENNITYMSSN